MTALDRPATARVLVDESHAEAWTIRPEVARSLLPAHPEDVSYAAAADALRARDLDVRAHVAGPLDDAALAAADVLVIAHPSDPAYERSLPGSPRLTADELDAIERWVLAGGGLVVLGEEEQDKYGNNLNDLLARFGLRVRHGLVQDYEHHRKAPSWVLAEPQPGTYAGSDPLARTRELCCYRAGTLKIAADRAAHVVARTSASASEPHAPLIAITTAGRGRVVVAADSDLFGDDCIGALDHEALWTDLVTWAAAAAFATPAPERRSALREDPAWADLLAATGELRLTQQPDGSVDLDAHDAAALGALVDRMVDAIERLAEHVPHQREQLAATVSDLRAWVDGGFGKPAFDASLELFRPDLHREDGIEHLVVFPMYKQNGSRDTCFEALIVRVPWPAWLAELERTRFDNPKFVPVELVEATAGYDSDCAVLFPETVSVAGATPNHFGAIFCDREAERFRRVAGAAADLLHVNLPPDAAALLASPSLSQEAFVLWDLVHDRAHSRGDLPFDPFMIRQRSPYWMYSLEELRCDLTAFGEAVRLEGEGFHLARHVHTAVLFDRIFRFPITGSRVRNYDGLGGQLLFASLHKRGIVHWTDNRLTIEWERLPAAVAELRGEVEELYRAGIDRSKVSHWIAAHELVAGYVAPSTASQWTPANRPFTDESEPKAWIDVVQADEFPLSMFYLQLQGKLASVGERVGAVA